MVEKWDRQSAVRLDKNSTRRVSRPPSCVLGAMPDGRGADHARVRVASEVRDSHSGTRLSGRAAW